MRNLAHIIQARTQEILEQVVYEIEKSGYADKLIGGIVLTGGGAQLKDIRQLTSYVTAKDTRIGLPGEHLNAMTQKELRLPLFATGIGLVIHGIENIKKANDMISHKNQQGAKTDRKKTGSQKRQRTRLIPGRPNKIF